MGLSSNADLDLDKLSDVEREIFSDIIANPPKAKTEAQSDSPDRGMPMRDAFSYEIKMKKGPKYVTLKFDDKSIPEKVYKIFQKYISDTPSV